MRAVWCVRVCGGVWCVVCCTIRYVLRVCVGCAFRVLVSVLCVQCGVCVCVWWCLVCCVLYSTICAESVCGMCVSCFGVCVVCAV